MYVYMSHIYIYVHEKDSFSHMSHKHPCITMHNIYMKHAEVFVFITLYSCCKQRNTHKSTYKCIAPWAGVLSVRFPPHTRTYLPNKTGACLQFFATQMSPGKKQASVFTLFGSLQPGHTTWNEFLAFTKASFKGTGSFRYMTPFFQLRY